jgi:hypothetical protein
MPGQALKDAGEGVAFVGFNLVGAIATPQCRRVLESLVRPDVSAENGGNVSER